jgi:cytochrome b6-f complex iron-sulfur subunit
MSDEKQNSGTTEAADVLGRRQFFIRLGVGSMAIAAAGTGLFGYDYLTPRVLYEASPLVNVGKPDQYPVSSVTFDPTNRIYIVRENTGFYSLSAVCTHLGCVTAWKPELDMIACPCHGSKFKKDGVKIEGPAPRPLPWLRMWVNEEGDMMVDRSLELEHRQFVQV